ncbi:MAG: SH3 domain-containing protein [Chloroflexi bacterium]|nr:SH3 domain-containing protein [Chloroflexota bacterium]
MKRLLILFTRRVIVAVCLALAISAAAFAAPPAQNDDEVPPFVRRAIDQLAEVYGRPLEQVEIDQWNFVIDLYDESSLGCPNVAGTPIPRTRGYQITLVVDDATYDYRVSDDGAIAFRCSGELPGAPPPPPDLPPRVPAAELITECPAGFAGYLPPRLTVGGQARVEDGGVPNRLRTAPSRDAEQIGVINSGEIVPVIGGPSCDTEASIVWWQVNAGGVTGWTAEGVPPDNYYLEPSGEPTGAVAASDLPLERALISTGTLGDLATLAILPVDAASQVAFAPDQIQFGLINLGVPQLYTLPTLMLEPNPDLAAIRDAEALAFSAESRYVAVGNCTEGVRLFDQETGQTLVFAAPTTACVTDLAFSSGDHLAVVNGAAAQTNPADLRVDVYDVASNTRRFSFPITGTVPPRAVAFSPDATRLAWLDSALHVVDLNTGVEQFNLPIGQPAGDGLAFAPGDNTRIAVSDGQAVRLVNTSTRFEQRFELGSGFEAASIDFSLDGSLLVVGSVTGPDLPFEGRVTIFDAATGAPLLTSPGSGATLTFSPDGSLLVVPQGDEILFLGIGG